MQCNNNDDNENNNKHHNIKKIVWFFGFLYPIFLFFGFICLFQRRIPTSAFTIYFSI